MISVILSKPNHHMVMSLSDMETNDGKYKSFSGPFGL